MTLARTLLLVAIALLTLGAPLRAQGPDPVPTLLADNLRIQANNTIIASGNVELFAGDIRLTASSISYNGATDTLTILGPIVLTQGTQTIFLASSAELDSQLRNGIMRSARMVLDQQMQLAAVEINRVDGRYTQLYKTVASSCQICGHGTPLWEIRAERIIHDQQERQLYFDNAQLRVAGIPIFYLPRMRLPDPTLKRATGFLEPVVRLNSRLGSSVKIPYFITLGDSADITITPYLSPITRTVELRYRQAFRTGRLQFDTALTSDKLLAGKTRGYLFGRGNFTLPRDFRLRFDLRLTSDPAYLLEYGYSGDDRLQSELAVTRTRADEYMNASITGFRTLRGSELAIDDQLPNIQGRVDYEKRFFPVSIGGQGSWSLGLESHSRASNLDQLGRDVLHLGGRLDWSRTETFGPGFVGRIGGELAADIYRISQDTTYASSLAFITPAFEAELRWPWVKSGASGASMVLEPVIHLAWTRNFGANVPNEDSTLVEFDEGNLFAISRFPGEDRYERGFRTTAGLKWTRYDPGGWTLALAAGRIYRDTDPAQFSAASGLDGAKSDWLAAGQLQMGRKLHLTARALFKDDLSVTKAETMVGWNSRNLSLNSTYSWIIPDPSESRPNLTSQLGLTGRYQFRPNWSTSLRYRYDFDANKPTQAAIGLNYTSECIAIDLSLSRRFTSSTSVAPTTDVGLSVKLLGFGANEAGPAKNCSGI